MRIPVSCSKDIFCQSGDTSCNGEVIPFNRLFDIFGAMADSGMKRKRASKRIHESRLCLDISFSPKRKNMGIVAKMKRYMDGHAVEDTRQHSMILRQLYFQNNIERVSLDHSAVLRSRQFSA